MKKFLVPLAILLVSCLLIVSCSSQASPSATNAPATSAKPAPATSSAAPAPPASSAPASSAPAATAAPPQPSAPASSAPPATGAQQRGGTLRLAFTVDATSLGLPYAMQGTPDQISSRPAVEPLFRQDNSGGVIPWLVDTYKEDPAAKTITLNLKKGIKFHDGTDFNAAAVKWNLETFKASPAGGGTFGFMTGVDVVDDSTARINLSQWDNTLVNNLASAPPGYIISPTAFQKNGADWCEINPVGTGPFTFVSWQRDVKKVFKRNDNYWIKGQPYLDAVEFSVISDPTTEAASLIKGDIDIIVTATVTNAATLKDQGFNISRCPACAAIRAMVGDSAHADSPFAKLEVRQAISYAIDQQAIIDSVWKGYMVKINQYAMPGTWSYSPDVKGYPYNKDKAKQLLAQAGYASGLKTTLYVLNDPFQVNQYTAVQNYLKDVGITADLQVLDSGKYVAMQMSTGWSNGIYGLGTLIPADPLGIAGATFRTNATSIVGKNLYKNPEIDKTIDDAYAAPDFATKQKLTWQLQSLIHDKYCLWTPVIAFVDLSAKNKKIHDDGVDDIPFGLWTPEKAWISK